MKNLLSILLISFTLMACSPSDDGSIAQTSPKEAAGLMANDFAQIIDVRTKAEWDNEHIDGAVHIPLDELKNHLGELKEYKGDLIVHCAVGGRSSKAVEILQQQGFTNASNMNGGLIAWKKAKLPVK